MKNRPQKPVAAAAPNDATGMRPARRSLNRRGPAPLVLEQRIMFDGATVDAVVAAKLAVDRSTTDGAAVAEKTAVEKSELPAPAAVLSPSAGNEAGRHEILFVEDNVDNFQQLVAGAKDGVEVVVLDHTRDGLQQMIDALKGHEPVDAIHLVTHGAAGQIDLGSDRISIDNIDSYRDQLAQLGQSITADGDLLLYGCDVAQGDAGSAFVDRLSELTKTDVAASTDTTGSAAFDGNWNLEEHNGTVETRTLTFDQAGWDGELVTTVYNANWQTLDFNHTGSSGANNNFLNIVGTGVNNGDVIRFNDVITIGGQKIDAVVTTTLDHATISTYDDISGKPSTVSEYFQPDLKVTSSGGGATFKVDFYLAGTYTGTGTGTAVTLQNVVVNSYDIDSSGGGDRQYQNFKGFARYELSTDTTLNVHAETDGSVTFTATTATNNSTLTTAGYRVKVYYDSMSSFEIKTGVNNGGSSATAYFGLDFSVGPGWLDANGNPVDTVITGTPAANVTYDRTTFTEAVANDGSISTTATLTLANGTFSGTNGQAISGVTFSNVPAGLTAELIRTSDTTATLSFTGNATSHANANDINNLGVSLGDAAFTSGNAAAVTGATRSDIIVDFADAPADSTAPVVTAAQSFSYAENRSANAVIGTVAATDAVGVTGFRFSANQSATSADGYFTIGSDGKITITAAGAAASISANDFETAPNSFTYGVQARDAAGNWSASENVALNVTNIDEVAPAFTSGTTANAAENQNLLYTAQATDAVDFTNHTVTYSLKSATGDVAALSIDASTGAVTLASGNLDFESKSSYSFTVIVSDATGNTREQAVSISVTNVDEVAPAFTSGATANATENQNLLYTAQATDAVDFTNHTVTYSLKPATGDAAALSIDASTGAVTLASGNLDFEGKSSYSFTVIASDATGNTREQAVTVSVTDADEIPPAVTITSNKAALKAGESATLTFTFSEDVGSSFVAGDISVESGSITNLTKTDATHYTATYTPADGTSDNSMPITVGIGAFSDVAANANAIAGTLNLSIDTLAPVITGPGSATGSISAKTIDENTTAVHSFTASETVSWSIGGGEDQGKFQIDGNGNLAFKTAPDYESPTDGNTAGHNTYVVQVKATDNAGNVSVQTVTVTVGNVNEAPTAGNTSITTNEDTAKTGTLPTAGDVDGDTVTYAKASDPAHGTVTVNADGSYTYTPTANYNGADSFSYTISDGNGGTNTYTVGITVGAVNDAPTASGTTVTTNEDTAKTGTLPAAGDVDGDTVTYAKASDPAHGTVTVNADGSYTYTPAANYNGADSFSYTISDGNGGTNTYTVGITVNAVNDAPVASTVAPTTGTIGEPMTPLAVPAFTDIDSPALTYSATLGDGSPLPAWLNFDPATRTFSGTPPANTDGSYVLKITGSDGSLSDSVSVTLTVQNPHTPDQAVVITSMTRDTGISPHDFITADGAANRTVTGTLDSALGHNEVVQVSFDGGVTWSTATTTGTAWSIVDGGAHGADWTIKARVTNIVVNESGPVASRDVTLDTAPPATPTVDTISSASTAPILSGTAAIGAGETLQVTVNGATYDVVPQDGKWTLDLASASPTSGTLGPIVAGNSYDVTATVTDTAGNAVSDRTTGELNISVPPAPPAPVPAPANTAPPAPVELPPPAPAPTPIPTSRPVELSPVVPGSVVGNDSAKFSYGHGIRSTESFSEMNIRRDAALSDVYTRSEGFRTVVAKADDPALVLFQGVPDQYVETGNHLSMTVPADAFAHTQPKAVVRLAATLQDGRPLPAWVQFNGQTGQFSGDVPKGLVGELRIKLIARDMEGREATALFRINVGNVKGTVGKTGLSEQLRRSGTQQHAHDGKPAALARSGT